MAAVICCPQPVLQTLKDPRTITRAMPHKEMRFILASKTNNVYRGPIDRNQLATLGLAALRRAFTSVSVLYPQLEWIASKI